MTLLCRRLIATLSAVFASEKSRNVWEPLMDVRCRIELFGSLRVFQDEQVHTRFRTHKAAWLLAYLALHLQQEHPREHLIDLFWPDMESKAGSDNLSTALSQLRRQLEPVGIPSHSIIVADRQQVRLNPETVRTDVSDFDRLIQETRHGNDLAAKAMLLKQAIGLYKGKVLPSCYEEWAIEEQRRCQIVYQESLHQLAACLEQSGRFAEALVSAQQATIADPYDESNYQTQMRLLVHLDRPAAAMQVYERMKTRFQQELSTLPDLTTRRIAEALFRAPRRGRSSGSSPSCWSTMPVPFRSGCLRCRSSASRWRNSTRSTWATSSASCGSLECARSWMTPMKIGRASCRERV